jgi:hypothetical protein
MAKEIFPVEKENNTEKKKQLIDSLTRIPTPPASPRPRIRLNRNDSPIALESRIRELERRKQSIEEELDYLYEELRYSMDKKFEKLFDIKNRLRKRRLSSPTNLEPTSPVSPSPMKRSRFLEPISPPSPCPTSSLIFLDDMKQTRDAPRSPSLENPLMQQHPNPL